MEENKYVYMVKTFNIKPKTEEMWAQEFNEAQASNEDLKDITLEEFKEKRRKLYKRFHGCCEANADYYYVAEENRGMHDDLENAKKLLEENITDIWECYYNYASITKYPLNTIYPHIAIKPEDIITFEFDKEKNGYREIKDQNSDISNVIKAGGYR